MVEINIHICTIWIASQCVSLTSSFFYHPPQSPVNPGSIRDKYKNKKKTSPAAAPGRPHQESAGLHPCPSAKPPEEASKGGCSLQLWASVRRVCGGSYAIRNGKLTQESRTNIGSISVVTNPSPVGEEQVLKIQEDKQGGRELCKGEKTSLPPEGL